MLKGISTLDGVHAFCMQLKNRVKPIAYKLYNKHFIEQMVTAYDSNQFGFYDESYYFIKKDDNDLFWGTERYIRSRIDHLKLTNERDTQIDFGFTLVILPNRKSIQVLLFAEQKELIKSFRKMKEVVDYHYQNSCDKPNNITKKNWEKRRADWDYVLGGDGYATPAESGFEYQPYNADRLSMIDMDKNERKKLNRYIPKLEVRAKRIAHRMMHVAYELNNPIITEGLDIHEIRSAGMDRYWKYCDYERSDDGKEELKNGIEYLIPQLKAFKNFTDFDVKMEFHENTLKILNSEDNGKPYWYTGNR